MNAVLVDSNVLLDVITQDHEWSDWSTSALREAADSAPLVINPIIYAETSVRFSRIETLEAALSQTDLRREAIPFEAAFLAGKAFVTYRRRGGIRRSPLPDFFIGAHAAVRDYRLLTRDGARYRDYFPKLELVAPD